ncbi:SPRY domain-containing protein [Xylariomycetidae sp. FL2044]|nr:SPRY domain-containing protein [Xylariomycetidae sp. FL2044]
MTNPSNHGSSGFVPDMTLSGFVPRIRTSYPSPVSGTNPSHQPSPFPRLGRIGSYHINSALESSSDLYSAHSPRTHTVNPERNGNSPDGASSATPSRGPQLPAYSRAFEMFKDRSLGDESWSVHQPNHGFFKPSYLRGSTYLRRLEETRRAKQIQKETQQQAGGGLQTSSSSTSLNTKTPASHLGMTYDLIERAPVIEDDSPIAPLPTKWNKDDKHGGLEVLADGLEVKYTSTRSSREPDHEVCGIRADHPMPSQAGIYYFEVTLLSRRRDETSVCIGFSTKSVNLSRPPGWEAESWGYHGDDGDAYSGHNVGKAYNKPFGPGDVIGCGVNFRTGEAFFTRNSKYLDTAFRDIKGKLYPSIGMKKSGEHIRVNFGQTPFIFDIDDVVQKEKEIHQRAIATASIENLVLVSPPMHETDLIQQLVLQFLQHDGYVETARAFAEEIHAEQEALNIDSNVPVPEVNIKDDENARRRQRIRRAILEGDIDRALKYTNAYYPNVLEDNDHVYFKLKCRKFIEMVRRSAETGTGVDKKSNGHSFDDIPNQMDVDESVFLDRMDEDGLDIQMDEGNLLGETIAYGRSLQAEFKDDPRREVSKTLNDVFALLAYSNPLQVKEIAPLLDRKGRVAVAEELNSAILSSLGKSSRSALENLYGQTSVLLDYLTEGGGPGSFVNIQSVVDQIPKNQPF